MTVIQWEIKVPHLLRGIRNELEERTEKEQ